MAWLTKPSGTQQIERRDEPYLTDALKKELDKKYAHRYPTRRAMSMPVLHAIQELYNVRVTGVATQNRKGKTKRTRFGYVEESTTKKAVVSVHKDDAIELF